MRRALPTLLFLLVGPLAVRAEVSPRVIEALWHKLPKPRLAVAPTPNPPAIDGTIDEKEWQAASQATDFIGTEHPKWKGIGGFDLVDAQTTVFATYDGTHLYVAFRCAEPEIETLVVKQKKQSRDGALWWDDCVELFLVPPGDARYHLILNSKGEAYDAKAGKGKSDRGWNLEGLNVAASISPPGEGSHWTVELAVPFAGLGVAAPKRGEAWGINFARERWAALYRNIAEQSTWSGLVGSFERPDMFGEICFTDLRQAIRLPRPFLGRVDLAAELRSGSARTLTMVVKTASASGASTACEQPLRTPAGPVATATARAQLAAEGPQALALILQDKQTRDILSCTRQPFHVPEVLTLGSRVSKRLRELQAKAGADSEFARSVAGQLETIERVAGEAQALLDGLAGKAADAATRGRWKRLHDEMAKVAAAATFAVWTCSPYVATGPSSMPPKLGPPPKLVIGAAQNEYAHAVVNLTNLTEEPIEFRLDGELPGQVGRPRSGLDTTVQQVVRFQPKLLGKKPNDVPETEDGLAMPLVELGGLSTFSVQPLSTRQIWVTVQTRELKPRTTRHRLRVVPLSVGLPAADVPVAMTVWPVRIEDEAPIGVFCFDYAGDYGWMRSYKINLWFRGTFPHKLALDAAGGLKPYKTDIGRVKQRIDEGARRFLFSYGYTGSFIGWAEKQKLAYMSPQWKRLFKEILGRMVREWREAGLDYGDFALQTIDEAHGHQVQQVLETTPLVREVDPKVRTAMTIMTDLADLKKMAPHVDVWVNRNGGIWGPEQEAFFRSEKAKGKPIWSWNMPCTPKSAPLTQFRTYGWRAMKFDFDAIGFFLYFGLVYQPMRRGGAIATRHWEAWRDGVEDYQLLYALRQAIAEARASGVAADKLKPSEELLAKAVDDVIGPKFFPPNTQETDDAIRAARAQVAAEIARVRKAK